MTMLWSCPQAECPPTDKPPRDVEELGEVAHRESQEVLSIQEVAKLLKVPVSAIYAWNRRGVGPPFYKVGSKLRYRKSNARKWLANTSSHARFAVASAVGPTGQMRSRRWRLTKISGLDPSLPPVWTAYTTEPLLTFLHPPVERAAVSPRS